MRRNGLFRMLCTCMLFFYGTAAVQAGQVITSEERDWAKQALKTESHLGDIASSKSLAVLNFRNMTAREDLDPLQKGLALMLITDLSKVQDIIVVERIRMQALLDEMDLGAAGLTDPQTTPSIGRMLKAYNLVNGDIRDGAIEELHLGSAILDVPFETVTDLPAATGALDELSRMEKDILFNIIEQLNIYVSPALKKRLEEPLSVSTAALLALFIGIDFSDKGNYAEAARMFDRALAEDPNLDLARNSLQELKDMELIESEDLSRMEPEPEKVAAESGGSGVGTVVGVGLALAGIGAGAAVLASSSSSSDDGGGGIQSQEIQPESNTPDPDPPVLISVQPDPKSSFCWWCQWEVSLQFSEPMNRSYDAAIDPGSSVFPGVIQYSWSDDGTTHTISHSGELLQSPQSACPTSTISFDFSSFQDVSGNPVSGTTSVTYTCYEY